MPRGNRNNLNPVKDSEEAKKRGKNGGIKSGIAKREKKTLKQELELLLELIEEGKTNQELISLSLLNKAKSGDTKAFEIIRDTIDQKPTNKQEIDLGNKDDKPFNLSHLTTEQIRELLKNEN